MFLILKFIIWLKKIGNSIWFALTFIEINLVLSLTCSYEINLKK